MGLGFGECSSLPTYLRRRDPVLTVSDIALLLRFWRLAGEEAGEVHFVLVVQLVVSAEADRRVQRKLVRFILTRASRSTGKRIRLAVAE